MTTESVKLCPTQQTAFDGLRRGLQIGHVLALWGGGGSGKTTVLREIQRVTGGCLLNMGDFEAALRAQHPLALEETYGRVVMDALQAHDTVIVDDLHLLSGVVSCNHFYFRRGLLEVPLTTQAAYAEATGKRLIIGVEGAIPPAIRKRCYPWGISEFKAADYAALCQLWLEERVAERLNYEKIYRFAPKLNAHQLRTACHWLRGESNLTTERFIDYIRSQRMTSNVDLTEVQAVNLHDLKGVDDVIQSLEANIILPLENDELANELNIKPKRGVLLAGPPGTGKTTVGRALAHRLKSKFFLIDGTVISGTRDFYERVQRVFELAKQNAPAIIFIDDSDVIFEDHKELGLYRYLLTMLDGLESESAGRICVMMTAMDVGSLPPALIRSGRVELWLETRYPDSAARAAILTGLIQALPPALAGVDVAALAAATEELTGADLKRLIEDGKILYAYDKSTGRPLGAATDYFLAAVRTVRDNKERYTQAEAAARLKKATQPGMADFFGSLMSMAGPEGMG